MTAKAVELLAAADMVAAEQYQPKPPRLWREPMWLVTVFVMAVLVLVSVAMLVLVRRSDHSDAQRARIGQVSDQIKDCVDPRGRCAQQLQQQSEAVVAELNRTTVIAVECADAYQGTDAIDACVARRLGASR